MEKFKIEIKKRNKEHAKNIIPNQHPTKINLNRQFTKQNRRIVKVE